ncbi:hypothetical protein NL676_003439 [Syzygium grande]|nr:hypothetical protein NL676_003439 [Syzygium grande]
MKIDRFDGKDFGFWKMQIEDHLYQMKLHLPLFGEKPETMKKTDWELLNRRALGVIRLTLTHNSCGKRGHLRRDCLKLKNDKGKGIRVDLMDDVAAIADGNLDSADYVLSVTDCLSFDRWIMDSGCSFHVTPNRNWFTTYQCMDSSKVQLRNNAKCNVVGVADVRIIMHEGIVKTLTEVWHVPKLKKNLISLSALDSVGCRYSSECGLLKVVQGALVIMKGIKHSSMYELQGETMAEFAVETSDTSV